MRVLLLSTTTGYQLRAFNNAADAMGIELAFATNHCDRLDDPWRDRAIPVKFHQEAKSVEAIVRAAVQRPLDGVIAVGDGPVALAALAAERLGLRGNPPAAARITRSKLLMREALDRAGLPVPWFFHVPLDEPPEEVLRRLYRVGSSTAFPCVVKPLALAASRGVMRADDERTFLAAFDRVRTLLERRDVRVQRNDALHYVLVEGYLEGDEFALEGVVTDGDLHAFALFDKPDPLVGPFFEETIYVTPSRTPPATQSAVVHTVKAAVRAIGLRHGPVHAEVRINAQGVYVLEVAARPIGGLCARALRFVRARGSGSGSLVSLEEVLLRHAVGERVDDYAREERASGVMMIPVPRRGVFKRVEDIEAARAVPGVEDVVITAKPDQLLVPLPEGASYPGFIFATAGSTEQVERSLREAHGALRWVIERPVEVL